MAKKLKESSVILDIIRIYGWAILVTITAIGVSIYFGVFTDIFISDNMYCKNNPDKCVLEARDDIPKNLRLIKEQYSDWSDYCLKHNPFNKDFCKLRLKTQEELDIDDCTSNPREDENCKCEEYGVTEEDLIKHNMELEEKNKIEQECLNDIQHNRYCGSTLIKIIGSCFKSRPKTEFEKHPELYKCETWEVTFRNYFNETNNIYWYTDEALKYNSSSFQEVLNDIKNKECIKWRNKTDWEKHPEDYVAETITQIKGDNFLNQSGYNECSNQCYKQFYYIQVEGEFRICDSRCKSNNTQWIEWEENQTTYRLKTECEKGNIEWVEEINLIQVPLNLNECQKQGELMICPPTEYFNQTICREKTDVEKEADFLKDCGVTERGLKLCVS